MVKSEVWSVSRDRVRAFFRSQPDVKEENPDRFLFGNCRITLTEQESEGTGIWATVRTRIHIEGEESQARAIYRRFFLQFLSAGG